MNGDKGSFLNTAIKKEMLHVYCELLSVYKMLISDFKRVQHLLLLSSLSQTLKILKETNGIGNR